MEMWAKIDGFPNYEISEYGRVRNCKTGRIMKTSANQKKYIVVCLSRYGKQYLKKVHILVAEAFVKKDYKNSIVQFRDGDRTNVCANNLYWTDYKDETRLMSVRNRWKMPGVNHKIIKPIRVIETGEIFSSVSEAADALGLSKASVSKSLNFRYYHNRKGYHFEEIDKSDLIW